MTDDKHASREELLSVVTSLCEDAGASAGYAENLLEEIWQAASADISAAAALLRANGWRVEEPRCGMCKGVKRMSELIYIPGEGYAGIRYFDCPTCNGTGAAKGDGK